MARRATTGSDAAVVHQDPAAADEGDIDDEHGGIGHDLGHGFAIVRGRSGVLQTTVESEDYEKLLSKAQLCVQDLTTEMFVTGDDEIQRGMCIYSEAAHELGYL